MLVSSPIFEDISSKCMSMRRLSSISKREQQVLEQIACGQTTEEIAAELEIGCATVQTYRQKLRKKLRAENGPHLVAKAFRIGLLR